MRIMPQAGIYVSKPKQGWEGTIFILTGTKKGNTYWRPPYQGTKKKSDKFAYVLWTCVPTIKDLQENYIKCSSLEEAFNYFTGVAID